MTKYIAPFFKALFVLIGWTFLYGLVTYLLSLIHPLAPALAILLAMAGAYAFFKVKDRESEAEIAALRAETDAELEDAHRQLEATCARIRAGHAEPLSFDVEADHTQCSDAEDDDAPLARYREDDPVQRI